MPFSLHYSVFIALPVYLPVRADLRVLKANYLCFVCWTNVLRTKQTAKYAYSRLFGTSHFIHEHGWGG